MEDACDCLLKMDTCNAQSCSCVDTPTTHPHAHFANNIWTHCSFLHATDLHLMYTQVDVLYAYFLFQFMGISLIIFVVILNLWEKIVIKYRRVLSLVRWHLAVVLPLILTRQSLPHLQSLLDQTQSQWWDRPCTGTPVPFTGRHCC